MQSKYELLKLGQILHEDTYYQLYSAAYKKQPAVALKIKGIVYDFNLDEIDQLKEKISVSNNSSVLKLIDVVSDRSGSTNMVIIENFSNIFYELLANNLKFSQHDILNYALTLSESCASLVSEGYVPKISFETVCLDKQGAIKLIHPHLLKTLSGLVLTPQEWRMSKANNKMKFLFRAPGFSRYNFDEAASVYEFGLFLLYSSIGNLDFMNKSDTELDNIAKAKAHPAIPAHCHQDIATLITNCLKPEGRPSFAQIRDFLSIHPKIEQVQTATKKVEQEKSSLLSRIPRDIINHDLMKAIDAYGVFARNSSLPITIDNSCNNTATPK
ncbi:Protein tyrosine kinase [Legionella massiliensis]|uniref:Protein tyrosine kinase n=1 Tax=Legionella massiliensis TaxID=1034943 RepID=A0A078KXZ4_9GAMM|nr:protein kinase [Legionella massiliensis]CDZ76624.1 Protein tyrosine kinase [Legionella massiliensis]CEE12362.1 Protein tyrosine kinase [Legionella massiliensis]